MLNYDFIKERLDDHENRIRQIEDDIPNIKSDIKVLIKSMSNLTKWIQALVVVFTTASVGFIFWILEFLLEKVIK